MSRLTLLALTYFYLLLLLLPPTIITTPAPVPASINGGQCGPTTQDTPNYPNTCDVAPTLVESPQPYGINCTALTQVKGALAISWNNCAASYQDICTKALDSRTRKGIWIWSMLAENCVLGFFLPPFPGSAQLLNNTRCVEIFAAMSDTCSTVVPASNWGGVNLRTIPGHPPSIVNGQAVYDGYPENDVTFQGDAVNVGYPSYAISYTPPLNPDA